MEFVRLIQTLDLPQICARYKHCTPNFRTWLQDAVNDFMFITSYHDDLPLFERMIDLYVTHNGQTPVQISKDVLIKMRKTPDEIVHLSEFLKLIESTNAYLVARSVDRKFDHNVCLVLQDVFNCFCYGRKK